MIPVEFDYTAPESLEEALAALHEGGEDAKLLAGGHSLLPLMKLRLAAPTLLVDLRRVPGLSGIERENGTLRIGAMTHHAELEDEPSLGIVSHTAAQIADRQVRHRGTIGGSLVHGDPASDLPTVMLACEGSVGVRRADGMREIPANELFQDYLTTAVGDGEIVTEVRLPAMEGYGFAYEKFMRRAEDWAMAGVCALVRVSDGVCDDVRVALTHMGPVPIRASAVEEVLRGQSFDRASIARAAENAAEGTEPPGDLNATPDYKRHLARVLTRRALEKAAGLAE